ncbi:UNKNOWN [Stylonychia lemnae]|uniref:Transmembrane protein n=1 Tax=Stylonychia lemnae TaxID=5949 RepID=A0A078AKI8_STYLE|nr:UNKNOWN [Stylonychia lemnae]|eukprot:CDW81343.1 UNKNOWN [Stylonychia lemnae]
MKTTSLLVKFAIISSLFLLISTKFKENAKCSFDFQCLSQYCFQGRCSSHTLNGSPERMRLEGYLVEQYLNLQEFEEELAERIERFPKLKMKIEQYSLSQMSDQISDQDQNESMKSIASLVDKSQNTTIDSSNQDLKKDTIPNRERKDGIQMVFGIIFLGVFFVLCQFVFTKCADRSNIH